MLAIVNRLWVRSVPGGPEMERREDGVATVRRMREADSGMRPTGYLLVSIVLLSIAGKLFVNLNEDPEVFIVFTTVFAVPGLYFLIAGGVAKGIAATRRAAR